jgi:hypothetical protein
MKTLFNYLKKLFTTWKILKLFKFFIFVYYIINMSNPIKIRCIDDSNEDMFVVSTNIRASTNSSTGALVINKGGLSINSTENAVSSSAGGSLTVGGGISIARDMIVGGDINVGVSNIFSGVFSADNNVSTPTNVSGLLFQTTKSFHCQLVVVIDATSDIYENFTLSGNKTNNGWNLYVSSFGDTSGVNFSITSGGQLQYTSTNADGTCVFRYFCFQF